MLEMCNAMLFIVRMSHHLVPLIIFLRGSEQVRFHRYSPQLQTNMY